MTSDTNTAAILSKAALSKLLAVTPKQARFVDAYVTTGNASEAARLAGYSRNRSNSAANRLLHLPHVKAAVDTVRTELAERTAYTREKAVQETYEGEAKAMAMGQPMAAAKYAEHRFRMTGHLVDRIDARVAVGSFSIVMHGLPAPEAVNA